MNLEPLGNMAIVKELKEEVSMTKGGIVIPNNFHNKDATIKRGKAKRGIVVEVGPGEPLQGGGCFPIPFKKGDKVVFSPLEECVIVVEGEELILLDQCDVIAKIKK